MRITFFASILILSALVYIQCGDTYLNLNYQNPCFEKDIVPLLRRDCARCHEGGEHNFKIEGKTSDYEIVNSYVNTDDPKESLFLKYALGENNGGKRHPQIWKEDSTEYVTFLNWVARGAKKECLYEDAYLYDTGYDVYALDVGYDTNYDFGIKDIGSSDIVYDVQQDVGSSDIVYDVQQDVGEDAGVSMVSFSKQIVPLIKTDCRLCHSAGQHGVKLTGTASDYSEVISYVDVNNPEADYGFLWWASGGGGHPNKWPKGGTRYNLFLQWIREGAQNN